MIRSTIARKSAHYFYMVGVALPVITLGASAIIPLSIANIVMGIAVLVIRVICGPPADSVRRLYVAALVLLVALLGWIGLQVATPSFLGGAAAWRELAVIDLDIAGPISIEPADSIAGLGYLTLPFLSFLGGLLLCRDDGAGRRLVRSLGYFGGAIALLGLLQFTLTPDMLLFDDKLSYRDSLTASFINRNSAATFLGLAAVVLVRAALTSLMKLPQASTAANYRPNGENGVSLANVTILSLLAVTAVTALLLTKSRAGIASSLLAIALLVILMTVFAPGKKRSAFATYDHTDRLRRWLRVIGAVIVIILSTAFFGGRFLLRTEVQGTEDGRFCVLPGILDLWRDNLWVGTGFGTFRQAFPAYRDPRCGLVGVWDKAHNFYLETGTSLGLAPLVMTIAAILVLAAIYVFGIRKRKTVRTHCIVGLASLILVSAHAFFDFSMQIPGVATYAAALFAATAALALGSRATHAGAPETVDEGANPARHRRRRRSPAMPIV